jgi:hypothetical protein
MSTAMEEHMPESTSIIPSVRIQKAIFALRGQHVMLEVTDCDLKTGVAVSSSFWFERGG